MIAIEYEKLISALAAASSVLASHQGEFSPADLRIRPLLNIAVQEAKRAHLEGTRQPEQREPGDWPGAHPLTAASRP